MNVLPRIISLSELISCFLLFLYCTRYCIQDSSSRLICPISVLSLEYTSNTSTYPQAQLQNLWACSLKSYDKFIVICKAISISKVIAMAHFKIIYRRSFGDN